MSVNGCVTLNGNFDLVLSERPTKNQNVSLNLISYNCSQQASISDSQIKVSTNYNDSKCDSVVGSINNQPNTLSISLSATLNKNCKGISKGAIIGIVVGTIFGTLVIILIAGLIYWRRDIEFDKKLDEIQELQSMESKNSKKN